MDDGLGDDVKNSFWFFYPRAHFLFPPPLSFLLQTQSTCSKDGAVSRAQEEAGIDGGPADCPLAALGDMVGCSPVQLQYIFKKTFFPRQLKKK